MDSANLSWATAILLANYAAVLLFFVVRGARRTKSMRDYALGNMTFSPWFVGLSLAAASTSAATFIINPGFIALYGWSAFLAFAVFLPLGKYLSLILMTKRFRKQGLTVKTLSMAQWIGNRYDSKGFALFFAVLSLLLITFMVLICVGMTKVLSQALHIGEMTALTGIVVFVFGYMMFGGANSMVYTNTVQAFLKLLVAIILIGSGYKYMSAGLDDFWRQVAAIDPVLTASVNPGSPLFRDYFEIIFCPFIVGIAVVCQPHIITKSLLLKKDSDVNKYLTAGILVEIIFFSVVIAGLYARLAFPDLQADGTALKMDGIMPAYVVREFTIWTALIIIIGLISSGLATFEGLIQSLSTTITTDILDTIWGKKISENDDIHQQKQHFINKIVIVGLAVTTFLLARDQLLHPKLSVGIFAQLGVYGFFSTAFVPVLFGIFLKNTPVEQIRRNFTVNFFQWPTDAEFMYQDRLFLRETAEWDAWCRMVPQCVSGMLNEPVFDRLGQITLPTLILFGENDYLIPNKILHKDQSTQQIAQLAQSKIPGSRLKMLQQCGHFAQWEQAALTNLAIREFLTD